MLKKLMKYEYREMTPLLAIAWGACILFAVVSLVSCAVLQSLPEEGYEIPLVLAGLIYVSTTMTLPLLLSVAALAPLALAAWRFYRHVVQDEAYLYCTLPIERKTLYHSKLIPATILSYISALAVGIAAFIGFICTEAVMSGGNPFDFSGIGQAFAALSGEIGMPALVITIVSLVIVLPVLPIMQIAMVYFSILLGQMVNKRKLLCSILSYFAANTLFETLFSVVFVVFEIVFFVFAYEKLPLAPLVIAADVVLLAGAYGITVGVTSVSKGFLRGKLNLE